VIPSAYLRVFRPLDAFSEGERGRWERYILAGGQPRPSRPVYRDESPDAPGRLGVLASAEGEYADVRLVDGTHYVCPWRTRLRILAGILSLRESAPSDMVDAIVPEAEARRAARELARIKRRDPSATPSILQSAWHVPVRWFVLVDDEDRHLVEAAPGEYRLYYWTPIGMARRRADRALGVLRRSELAPVAELIQELAQWLAGFPTSSVVELDYGAVSALFSWDELDDDHSGHEIQQAVEAIGTPGARGMARAAELYQSVTERWAEAMIRESMN
jgi:hypothetical protein